MDAASKVAAEAAKRFIHKPERKGLPEDEYQLLRHRAEFELESAAKLIAQSIEADRKAARAEIIEACAKLAEEEFAGDDAWDEPVYSALGAGRWIATAIRSMLTTPRTNNPPELTRKRRVRKKKEENDE